MIIKFFNGKYFSNLILKKIRKEIFFSNFFLNRRIYLAIILLSNNFSSNLYVKNKIKACLFVKINFVLFKFSASLKFKTLLKIVSIINNNFNINGIIIQLPLIKKINKKKLFKSLNPFKDVDLLNPVNFGVYSFNFSNLLIPSTAKSILFFLHRIKIKMYGAKCIVFGYSNIVGKPMVYELIKAGSTVIIINKNDNDFSYLSKSSDIIITAIGVSNFLSSKLISNGTIVVDVGINEYKCGIASGDVNLFEISDRVSYMTPVPGGIGPLTVAYLISNLIRLSLNKNF